MWKRRITWAAVVLAAFILFLFDNNGGTRAILLTVLLVPLLSAGLLLLFKPKLSAELEVPEMLARGEIEPCTLVLRNRSVMPITWVECGVEIENLLTGERGTVRVAEGLSAGEEARIPIQLTVSHCGALALRTGELQVMDFFSLVSVKPEASARAVTVVPPVTQPVDVLLAEEAELFGDSQRYSGQRAGNDPSETFQLRDYAPGDPVRRIHWKLTEKLDKPLVRDFGLPRESRLLLRLEDAEVDWNECDKALDVLFSTGAALCEREVPCTVRWSTAEGEQSRAIYDQAEWDQLRRELLCTRMRPFRLTAEGMEMRIS